uniref:Uncharacterized protein n=1 Tax=Amazona collaria TaxID=241587 RepID=A0A8B9FLM9_9PSIT
MPFRCPPFLLWLREKETAELKEQVAALKSSIAEEEERAADLKLKVQLFSSGEDDQDNILASLSKKVQEVYCQCTGESGGNLQTVEMLMVLEKQLYDLLDNLDEKTEHAMKLKEKERRMNGKVTQSTESKDAAGQLIVSAHPQVNQIQTVTFSSHLIFLSASFFTFAVERVRCFLLVFCKGLCVLN